MHVKSSWKRIHFGFEGSVNIEVTQRNGNERNQLFCTCTMAGSGARSRRQRTKTKHYTDDDPSTFTTKEKKGERGVSVARTPSPVAAVVAKKRPRPKRTHAASSSSLPRPNVSLSHHIRTVPLFTSTEPQHSIIHGRGLGIPPPLKKPEWTQMPHPLSYFPDEPLRPASCTCLASDSTSTYMAMGDTTGFVSIYLLQPKLLCVSRLTTSASTRETQSDLKLPQAKKFGLYQKKTHPNQIQKLALAGGRVVLATKHEIECLDAKNNTILWSLPIDIPVQCLDIHPQTHQVIVSFSSDSRTDSSSPLLLLDMQMDTHTGMHTDTHMHTDTDTDTETQGGKCSVKQTLVHPKPNNGEPQLQLGGKCAAIWDKSNRDCIISAVLLQTPAGSVEQELLRLDKNTFTILNQVSVPNKPVGKSSCHTVECLSQSPSGHLTLVSSTKGIRLLETSTFGLLRVFGDSVSLHGHSLLFQQCCFVQKPILDADVDDLLDARQKKTPVDDKHWMEQNSAWILGVPFGNREPRELRDTLHLWDLWEGKHTYATIMAPPKAEGFVSVEQNSGSLIITTQTGSCYTLSPTVRSDFSGIMYPPGYQVVNDNLEYIEDEDDLDVVVVDAATVREEDEDDDEDQIAEALRLSMKQAQENVDVATFDDPEPVVLPCHPEPFLKKALKEGISPVPVDSKEYIHQASFASSLLLPMPLYQGAMLAKQDTPVEDPRPILTKPIRAKRSKAASLEALLKSSLNPELRKIMVSRHMWVEGSGSRSGPVIGDVEVKLEADNVVTASGQQNGCNDSTLAREELDNPPIVSPSDGSVVAGSPATQSSIDKATAEEQLTRIEDPKRETDEKGNQSSSGDVESATNSTTCVSEQSVEDASSHSTDLEKGKLDAAAALLMSASGELDSPLPSTSPIKYSSRNGSGISRAVSKEIDAVAAEMTETKSCGECRACGGRWVFHSCGKKAKPVDYDELMKAEQEKKDKEEEEKRKHRAEKRRLADARRREARKKRKLEEEARIRLEEAERLRWEKARRQEELERSRLHSEDKDRRRADMLQRLQAEQASSATSSSEWPQTVQSEPTESPGYSHSYSASQSEWRARPHGFRTSREIPRQSNWPQPAQTSMASMEVKAQPSSYATDWPPPANHHAEPSSARQAPVTYASEGREWPQPAQARGNESTILDSHSRGAPVWPATTASELVSQNEPVAQSPSSVSSPATTTTKTQANEARYPSSYYNSGEATVSTASKEVLSVGQAQNSSSYYNSAPAPAAAGDSKGTFPSNQPQYPPSFYPAAPTATAETIDPAEALASLAMFATAAPLAKVTGHDSRNSDYSQSHEMQRETNAFYQRQDEQASHGFKSNGWGTNGQSPDQNRGTAN